MATSHYKNPFKMTMRELVDFELQSVLKKQPFDLKEMMNYFDRSPEKLKEKTKEAQQIQQENGTDKKDIEDFIDQIYAVETLRNNKFLKYYSEKYKMSKNEFSPTYKQSEKEMATMDPF